MNLRYQPQPTALGMRMCWLRRHQSIVRFPSSCLLYVLHVFRSTYELVLAHDECYRFENLESKCRTSIFSTFLLG